MKKIIRLTEGDLIKLIKRVINEGEDDELENIFKLSRDDYELGKMLISNYDITMDELYQKMVIKILDKLGFIDMDEVEVGDDEFFINSIKGKDFDYFDDGNYLRFEIELEDRTINLFVFAESYFPEEGVDSDLKMEVYKYMDENWSNPLFEEGILFSIDPFDDDTDDFY